MNVDLCDLEKAYQNGRADMKRETIQTLAELRSGTLGVMQALLTEMIERVAKIK